MHFISHTHTQHRTAPHPAQKIFTSKFPQILCQHLIKIGFPSFHSFFFCLRFFVVFELRAIILSFFLSYFAAVASFVEKKSHSNTHKIKIMLSLIVVIFCTRLNHFSILKRKQKRDVTNSAQATKPNTVFFSHGINWITKTMWFGF